MTADLKLRLNIYISFSGNEAESVKARTDKLGKTYGEIYLKGLEAIENETKQTN